MSAGSYCLSDCPRVRVAVRVHGAVQGVGFRPFVYRLALRHGLAGFVLNRSGIVEIEIEGDSEQVAAFLKDLRHEAPPLAVIDKIDSVEIPRRHEEGFSISHSRASHGDLKWVPPDMATCSECVQELFDPADRRYRYPFVNCTNCGPRFTIIGTLPYDRSSTTMADFAMCSPCRSEYEDPSSRRFHAQPNACAACGPSLSFLNQAGKVSGRRANDPEQCLASAVDCLRAGDILAVKGLGGFHLMCDALNESAVDRLRQRKGRYRKPLAVMMPDLDTARRYCHISAAEERLLTGQRRPIVLLKVKPDCSLARGIAPGLAEIGVMLPYTPLHELISRDFGGPVVATSGNLSEEPIAIDNDEAIRRLASVADAFLLHNRKIRSRYDDSLVRVFDGVEVLIRRSRGYAPLPLTLGFTARKPALACGGHLKNTFCLVNQDKAFLSQHIGDLDNLESTDHFYECFDRLRALFGIEPEVVACDLHPDYASTDIAKELATRYGAPLVSVQHHHAHIVSSMAEHGLDRPVIGVAFDGLGYGSDGSLWGGEFLICDRKSFARAGCLEPAPLPGGEQAIKNPWRTALGYILTDSSVRAGEWMPFVEGMRTRYGAQKVRLIEQQIERSLNSPLASSCGRLFDALSAMLGVCEEAVYEGQAAMELEAIAGRCAHGDTTARSVQAVDSYPWEIRTLNGLRMVDARGILASAYGDFRKGTDRALVAWRFHRTIADFVAALSKELSAVHGIDEVCLSGGVFQNKLLLAMCKELLERAGLTVFFPRKLPVNDGGISLGQAVVALSVLNLMDDSDHSGH